jgi:hypothetical protein
MRDTRRVNGNQYLDVGAGGYNVSVIALITLGFASGNIVVIQLSTAAFVSIRGSAKMNPSSLELDITS